jgi:U3 small nucleolar RNA-associated protein 25
MWMRYRYSSNADISRARQAFFTGKKQFLIITERFHFFRRYVPLFRSSLPLSPLLPANPRYKIRGILNLLFYAPPDHAQFYSELISFPFLDEEKVKEEDVSVKVLYSRYDWMRIERIVGNKGVKGVMKE